MLKKTELDQCRNASIMACNPDSLIDLRNVKIDTAKPVAEPIDRFMKQVHNPYLFKVDDVIVKVNFGNERPVADAFASVFLQG